MSGVTKGKDGRYEWYNTVRTADMSGVIQGMDGRYEWCNTE
jgi:hypothetical protein